MTNLTPAGTLLEKPPEAQPACVCGGGVCVSVARAGSGGGVCVWGGVLRERVQVCVRGRVLTGKGCM